MSMFTKKSTSFTYSLNLILLLLMIPIIETIASDIRYKVAACDWMMLKRQKIGEFQLISELGGDGIEMDMGALGKRDSFDNKLRDKHFQVLFKETAAKYKVEVPSIAMSGFYGQSFIDRTEDNFMALIEDCLNTMEIMGAKVAFLPLGKFADLNVFPEIRKPLIERLHKAGEKAAKRGKVIGIETMLSAEEEVKLLNEINSRGIKIYYKFQNAIERKRDICKELKILGKDRICMIHCSNTDGVTLPYDKNIDLKKIKKTLDNMGWSGWLVVERSRDQKDVHNVRKNYSTNIAYIKEIFQKNLNTNLSK